jgi:phenylacetic acid degradation protein
LWAVHTASTGVVPVVDPAAFVHPDAVLIGDVHVAADCYVGPYASLRGDFGRIVLGAGSNVQDSCVLHCFPGRDTVIAEGAHIGHGAVLHGCRIGTGALVGINAVVMDGVDVGEFAFVGAHSFVRADMVVPARTLVAGSPARIVRDLTDAEVTWKTNGTVIYQELARRSLATMQRCTPLEREEADRPQLAIDATRARPLAEFRAEQGGGTARPQVP